MVSSHTSLPGLTITTQQIKLWLSLATTLPPSKLYSSNKQENQENPKNQSLWPPQDTLLAKQKVPNITQPKYAPQPPKFRNQKSITRITNFTKITSLNIGNRQKHNSTLTPTFKQPGRLITWTANTPNHSLLQPSKNKK